MNELVDSGFTASATNLHRVRIVRLNGQLLSRNDEPRIGFGVTDQKLTCFIGLGAGRDDSHRNRFDADSIETHAEASTCGTLATEKISIAISSQVKLQISFSLQLAH